ncbi:MAG TPA: LytR C-terminal domain-containing protein [Jatrophihabitans sp.]|jgi:hypothetical protein|uniref:LytR C-terminal domain-containing protein n=1 Tax=Jatrophihabitans sp. TaxID=1932789 RepID=UPI002F189A3E
MLHAAVPAAPRRTTERLLGVVLVLAGLALAFIAYLALVNPGGRNAGADLLRPLATPPVMAAGPAAAAGPATAPDETGRDQGQAGQGAAAHEARSSSSPRALLTVLDNTGRPELARSAGDRFTQGGWTVTEVGAFDGDILSTAAYYDPSAAGSQAAAEALRTQFPVIQRVLPKFDGLGPGAVVVVLTYDYSQGQTTS